MTAAPTDWPPFRPDGDLPGPGLTVIEASAGTGKTYTLTSLVVRYVAEGFPLESLLAVTFTRMATGELRDRIRARMAAVHRGLSLLLTPTGGAGAAGDGLVELLASGPPDQLAARSRRLADALADFDAATIATTHGFCQMVLHGLGSAGDTPPDALLLEDPSDLVSEVVEDLYLRWSLTRHGAPPFPPAVARRAALAAVANPETAIFPYVAGDPPRPAAVLARLAEAARREVTRRLLQDEALTYDELLSRLARTLSDDVRGPEACRRLRHRYRVVLVDEFQDTDPVQWTILQQAFGPPGSDTRLVLIGDPKQAIYAFRGADVHAYLDAAESAAVRFTLAESWRADQSLLDATAVLFDPLQFGHAGIPFRRVSAPEGRPPSSLPGPPVRVRVVDDAEPGVQRTLQKGYLQKGSVVAWIAGDVASDISRLLSSGAVLPAPPLDPGPGLRGPGGPSPDPQTGLDGPGPGGAVRPLAPGDIAVLTRTNPQAVTVRDALRAAGVPAVVAGADSVFRSEACRAWAQLLDALQEPASRSRLVGLALSPFIGLRVEEVASAPEAFWEDLHDRVQRWASLLSVRGVAALHRAVTAEQGMPGRILGEEGGERTLTDLGHVAQLLHAEAGAGQLGAPSLRAWLAARMRAVEDEQAEAEERSRRLDSDAAAVQVLTVHRAKGLEFPVVYCPFLWDGGQPEGGGRPVVFHDPVTGARTLDCGCLDEARGDEARKSYDGHAAIADAEQRGEDLRLMYVAITRARHQVVLWWARAQRSGCSPLGRLLLCRDAVTGEVGPARQAEPNARLIRPALEELSARSGGLISLEPAGSAPNLRDGGLGDHEDGPLDRAVFDRFLDQRWRRSSYTSITAAAHSGSAPEPVGSEPERPGIADEPPAPPLAADGSPLDAEPSAAAGAGPASIWGTIPGGAEVGTFVHRVLEGVDFAAADLRAEIGDAVARLAATGAPPLPFPTLVDALEATLTTPLGITLTTPLGTSDTAPLGSSGTAPLGTGGTAPVGTGGPTALTAVRRADRLDELAFELPVAGGDRPTGTVLLASLADLLDRHLGAGDRLAGYGERLLDPVLDAGLRGYLVGSLDLVFRHRGPEGEPRWFVADYKTNWLGPPGAPLAASHYSAGALDAEMRQRHYPLQALLYCAALHRYLRWRQPGYEPETHFGGVLYLFVRGMTGPTGSGDAGSGVWSWRPPASLLRDLSDLLDGVGARP